MKNKTIIWVIKNIILPMLPFFMGFFLRFMHERELSLNLINPTELFFAFSIVTVLIISSITRLNDNELIKSLTLCFVILLVICMVLFAYSFFYNDLQLESEIKRCFISSNLNFELNKDSNMENGFKNYILNRTKDLNFLKYLSIILGVIYIPFTIYLQKHYKLEE